MWYNITLTIGIILLVISFFTLKKSLSFLNTSERVIGTVIKLEKHEDSEGETFSPVFKFTTSLNQEFIYQYHSSCNPPCWSVGEKATIVYKPSNPSDAKLLTYFGVFNWTIVLMAIAMPLIVVGTGYHLSCYFLK
jgi:hypothetical protein